MWIKEHGWALSENKIAQECTMGKAGHKCCIVAYVVFKLTLNKKEDFIV